MRQRLVQTTDANNGVTTIMLDGVGNETGFVDPANNQTTWTYSPTNLPLTETNSLGTTTNTYNLDQELTSTEDADGRVRDFLYNNDQQLTAENWMQGSTVIASMNYAYDLDNELTSASDPSSAYAFAYNGDGQVTSVDNNGTPNVPHVVLTGGYDLMGDRTSLSATIAGTADFANSYSYDADQQLTMVQQQGVNGGNIVSPKEVDYGYNAIGQFTGISDFNYIGVGPRLDILTGAYSYDNGARLTGIAYTSNGGKDTIDTLGWGYNAGNLVTTFTSIDGTASYGYDPTNQLTSATYTTAPGGHQPANESFSFDANGNRNSTGYTTGSANLMTSDGTFNFEHDADGNTTVRTRISNNYASDYRTTFTWDYRNRLTHVDYYDNNGVLTKHAHFLYDVFDNLIGEQDDDTGNGTYNSQQFYVVTAVPESPVAGQPPAEAAQPLVQFDGAGNLTERYLVAPSPAGIYAVLAQGAVSSLTQGDMVTWMADDNEGTPRDQVDNTGTVVNHSVFSSFGQDVHDSNPTVAHWAAFAGGHVSAATGFENEDERWLNLPDGDWLSQDPSGFAGRDTNLTRDVGNDPISVIDPSGLFGLGDCTLLTGPPYSYELFLNWLFAPPPSPSVNYSVQTNNAGSLGASVTTFGQPASLVNGIGLSDDNGCSTTVNVSGSSSSVGCNTINGNASSPGGTAPVNNGGAMTASLTNYEPGTYIVVVTYTITVTVNNNSGGGTVTIYTVNQQGILSSAGSPNLATNGSSGPINYTKTQTIAVNVGPNSASVPVISIQPTLTAPAAPGAKTTYCGNLSINSVTPVPPAGQTNEE